MGCVDGRSVSGLGGYAPAAVSAAASRKAGRPRRRAAPNLNQARPPPRRLPILPAWRSCVNVGAGVWINLMSPSSKPALPRTQAPEALAWPSNPTPTHTHQLETLSTRPDDHHRHELTDTWLDRPSRPRGLAPPLPYAAPGRVEPPWMLLLLAARSRLLSRDRRSPSPEWDLDAPGAQSDPTSSEKDTKRPCIGARLMRSSPLSIQTRPRRPRKDEGCVGPDGERRAAAAARRREMQMMVKAINLSPFCLHLSPKTRQSGKAAVCLCVHAPDRKPSRKARLDFVIGAGALLVGRPWRVRTHNAQQRATTDPTHIYLPPFPIH